MCQISKCEFARLGASCRDFSMLNSNEYKWEHILDKNGNRVNVNEGAINITGEDNHIIDNRIYLYASRQNGAVKNNAAVDINSITTEAITYDVYMKGVK